MVTWADAHRIAMIAAAHAHHDYGVNTSTPPVDVAGALARAGLPTMWRPMPRLFGAYLHGPGMHAGVLLNSAVPVGARRHTAAHELGHHCLGHSAVLDDGACLQLDLSDDAGVANGRHRWTDGEKTAEAFSAWFLMPRAAVLAAIEQLGLSRLDSPTDVYRVSLLLGTSYRSTVRHLPNLRLVSRDRARTWMTVAPGRLKSLLHPTGDWHDRGTADLWLADRQLDGALIRPQRGDMVVAFAEPGLRVDVADADALTWNSGGERADGGTWSAWIATSSVHEGNGHAVIAAHPQTDKGPSRWSVRVAVEVPAVGLDRHWITRMEMTG